jgi:hypothetical protein
MSLAANGTGIQLQGTASIVDSDASCGIFSNSAMSLGGNASITAGSVGAAGTVSVGGSSTIGPPPNGYTQGDGALPNPYASVTTPAPGTPGTCINDTVIKDAGTSTPPLSPGTYCTTNSGKNGALDVKNSTVTLNAGTYIINGAMNVTNASNVTFGAGTYTFYGTLSINGSNVTLGAGNYIFVGPAQLLVDSQSSVTGTGVTLAFTDPSNATYPKVTGTPTAMNFQSGANVVLEAPASGNLIIGNSNIPLDTAFNLQANAGTTSCTSSNCIGGLIYVPTGDFTFQGGPLLQGGCTQMIAYRVTLSGNATFQNGGCASSGGTSPTAGNGQTVVISLVK